MIEFNMLPIYRTGIGELSDGIEVKVPTFCREKYNKKCETFYEKTFIENQGLYTCPYGFNVYLLNLTNENVIFTAFRVKNEYNKKANPKVTAFDNNPIISKDQLERYIKSFIEYGEHYNKYMNLTSFSEQIVHDLRKYNTHIMHHSTSIIGKANSKDKYKFFFNPGRTIQTMSSYISSRLDAYDLLYNQLPLLSTGKTWLNLYKIFDKNRKCFEDDFKGKNIYINLMSNGECPDVKAYDFLEQIPFLLFDNCKKYSPEGTSVNINIEDTMDYQHVLMESIGPILYPNELENIFNNGYRGTNVKRLDIEGSGIGLFVLKQICDIHKMDIQVISEDKVNRTINGIEYSKFKTNLKFEKQTMEQV